MDKVKTRIRTKDTVQVVAGKGNGKRSVKEGEDAKVRGVRGKVISIDAQSGRAVVQGIKQVYKHQRVNRQDPAAPKVGRVQKEAPVQLSNLMLVCPSCDQATRTGIRVEKHEREGGKVKSKRIRVCKKCGADIPEVG